MANKLIKRRYNNLLTARNNYFGEGSGMRTMSSKDLDISKSLTSSIGDTFSSLSKEQPIKIDTANTSSKPKMSSIGNAVLQAAGSAVGQIGGSLIGGGLQSGAGSVLSGLSSVASAIPGPVGAIASAALGIAGGLTNRMFGSKLNQENIAKVQANIDSLNSFQSNASNYDSLAENWANASRGMTFENSFIGKDGWFSNKAKNKANELRGQISDAEDWVQNSLSNNAEAIMNTNMMNQQSNFAAFGGELNTNGGDFTNGLLHINNGGSHESNPYEGVQLGIDPEGVPNLVEEGETIFNDYVFSKRLKVPKAIRNKYKIRGTKSISFAEMSKKLAKESEERPNDPISMRGLEAMMADLANTQEELKAEKRQNSYAYGGKVNKFAGDDPWTPSQINSYSYIKNGYYGLGDTPFWIKDSNYTDQYKDFINTKYSIDDFRQHLKDQFNFYDNATGKDKASNRYKAIKYFVDANPDWYNHRGSVDTWNIDDALMSKAKQYALSKPGFMHPEKVAETYLSKQNTPAVEKKAAVKKNRYFEYGTGTPLDYFEGRNDKGQSWIDLHPGYLFVDKNGVVRDPVDVNGVSTTYTDYFLKKAEPEKATEVEDPVEWEQGKYADWLRYAPAVGFGISALTDTLELTNKPDYSNADAILEASRGAGMYQPVRFKPIGNYLTYRPFDRDFYINKMNAEAGASRRALLNTSGNNRATAMAGILAADNNYLNQIGSLARQAEEFNLAQRQQVADFNRSTNITNSQGFLQADMANQKALAEAREFSLKGRMTAAELRERARLASDQAKSANISGLFQTLGDIGFEEKNARMRDWAIAHGVFGPGTESAGRVKQRTTNKDKNKDSNKDSNKDKIDFNPGKVLYDSILYSGIPLYAATGGKLKTVKKRGLTF